jgi:uncharacterized protein YydD (DUF2326 family)
LEAEEVRLKTQVEQESTDLQSFRVHPQYNLVQAEANRLTEEIHQLVNANVMDKRLLGLYESCLIEEQAPEWDSVGRIYKEAGVALPGVTLRRLEDVQRFHDSIIENRRAFLAAEMDRLRRETSRRDQQVESLTAKRASTMEVLRTHGALEEYTLLQKRHMTTVNNLNSISTLIENLKTFQSSLSDIRIAQEELQKKARRDYQERRSIRERAISIFNAYSERLYNAPGKLVIDVGPTGFKFDVEIERSGSAGVTNMKVFCYDLMLARLWADRVSSPRILIHDSTIFDGVDERQRALALETAAEDAQQFCFQYICTLNSDNVPWGDFSAAFDLNKHINVRLTDQSPDGCLLGIRF